MHLGTYHSSPPVSDTWWWSLQTCSNLFIWGPTILSPLMTPGGDHWRPVQTCSFEDQSPLSDIWWWQLKLKHYGFQADSMHLAGMLSCLVGQSMTNQVSWLQLLIIRVICTTNLYPVVHPGFPRQGWGPKLIIWQGFCEKLHENVRNWAERGRGACP